MVAQLQQQATGPTGSQPRYTALEAVGATREVDALTELAVVDLDPSA
jgi:hypothetical protein